MDWTTAFTALGGMAAIALPIAVTRPGVYLKMAAPASGIALASLFLCGAYSNGVYAGHRSVIGAFRATPDWARSVTDAQLTGMLNAIDPVIDFTNLWFVITGMLGGLHVVCMVIAYLSQEEDRAKKANPAPETK